MTKVMVWNFKENKFEQATKEEGEEIISLMGTIIADCATQKSVEPTCTHPQKRVIGGIPYCKFCGEQLD